MATLVVLRGLAAGFVCLAAVTGCSAKEDAGAAGPPVAASAPVVPTLGPASPSAPRSNPSDPFVCDEPRAWSGTGTMSVLIAFEDYYSPKTPKGRPERLSTAGASFPLVTGVSGKDVAVASSSGEARGGISDVGAPAVQIAFTAKA